MNIRIPQALILILALAFGVNAQSEVCPKFEVNGPPALIQAGELVTFSAVVDPPSEQLTINWSVDKGTILNGQGTPVIQIGGTKRLSGQTIRATVEIGGLLDECRSVFSETARIRGGREHLLADEVGKISDKELRQRIDEFIKLFVDKDGNLSEGYIINYGTKEEAEYRKKSIQAYLRETGRKDARVTFVYGGEGLNHLSRFWLVSLEENSSLSANGAECPKIEVIGPPAVVNPGETLRFRAENKGRDVPIEWSVDKGTILEIPHEMEIVVGGTDMLAGQTIKAMAVAKGLPGACESVFSHVAIVAENPGCGMPADEFGELARDDVRARIDNIFINLQSDPTGSALIISYGPPDQVTKRHEIIRNHIELRKYAADRLRIEYKAYEEKIRTRVWIVPAGADNSVLN